FIFVQGRKRYISPETAAELKGLLKPEIKAVGVFIGEDREIIADIANRGIIDVIQLHGSESDEYIAKLRKLVKLPIIKVFKIESPEDAAKAEASTADLILADSGNGGTGELGRWDLIKLIKRDYILAGGLNPENVGEAVKELHPYAVDTSSGVETDGLKDPDKMIAFTQNARNA
ncbi:MAG: phosphoribosylanthranilate isomerase, partial [Clostridia bacterium]|nr:phosphoribosylanthranilate isomerase [Clostridia bacterium]